MLLAGCSAGAPPTPDPTSIPTIPSSIVLETGSPQGDEGVPAQDDHSRKAATELATKAVAAWVNTSGGEGVWRSGLAAWLSPEALEYYAAVDPTNIAPAEATGPAELVDTSSPYLSRIRVETTNGIYEVVLNRVAAGDVWQVQRVTRADVG